MGTPVVTDGWTDSFRHNWTAGLVGGIVGGIGMGVVLHLGANIMPFVGALYGWPTVVGGWAAHLLNSLLIAAVFTLIVSHPFIDGQVTTRAGWVAVGIVYAAAVGLVTSGLMLPIAMNLLGTGSFPEPLLPLPGVVGGVLVVLSVGVAHVVFGALLGAVYGRLHGVAGSTG